MMHSVSFDCMKMGNVPVYCSFDVAKRSKHNNYKVSWMQIALNT